MYVPSKSNCQQSLVKSDMDTETTFSDTHQRQQIVYNNRLSFMLIVFISENMFQTHKPISLCNWSLLDTPIVDQTTWAPGG